MFRVYWCLRHEHDPSLVALAVLLCIVSTFTAATFLCRHNPGGGASQRHWLVGAGLVTGVGVWATHFSAMLAYNPGLNIGIDARTASVALASVVIFSVVGWITAARAGAWQPVFGGLLVGTGLAIAHYLDMLSLSVAGYIIYDHGLVAASVAAGLSLCALSGWLIFRRPGRYTPLLATATLSLGICTLHFFGMAAVTILPDPSVVTAPSSLVANKLGGVVILGLLTILAAALAAALYDRRLAARSVADGETLKAMVTALQHSEERYRLAVKATSDAIWDWHHDTDLTTWGDAIGTRFGYPEVQSGTSFDWWRARIHPDDRAAVLASLESALSGTGDIWGSEFRFEKADGDFADVYSRGHILRDETGKAVRTVGSMIDFSERKAMEDSLRWAANHDSLTGLANRGLFGARLDEALGRASESGRSVGLVLIDIDHFKVVNDTHGHAAGDELLIEIAKRLSATTPDAATVARLGGDEFAIILPNLADESVITATTQAAMASLDDVFMLQGSALICSASFGTALWPRDADSAENLLKSSDIALYTAKSSGRAVSRMFSSDMPERMSVRTAMLERARNAIRDDRVVPFYQPKVVLETGSIAGFEALLRWQHPRHGLQLPHAINAAFQDVELATMLTDQMVTKIVEDVRTWLNSGIDFHRIAINGSPADFLRGDFADRFLETLHASDIDATRFEIEVTESVFFGKGVTAVESTLRTLSRAGVSVALDDFGTGYASLSHLKQFPVDVIKIDQSFVHRLDQADDDNAAIVRAVIAMARSMRITTVAEGIETGAQRTRLISEGCELGQGFLFSHAVAAAQVPILVNAQMRAPHSGSWFDTSAFSGDQSRAA